MEELLIENVREHQVLYNSKSPDYRDQKIRQEAWDEIGSILKMKAETAKDSWDKLRRCFMNAINRRRSKKSGQAAKKIPPWKYEQQMSFLLPFMENRKTHSNVMEEDIQDDLADIDYAQESENDISETNGILEQSDTDPQVGMTPDKSEVSHRLDVIKKKNRETRDNPIQEMINVMKENASLRKNRYEEKHAREMDETDMFFLSMAKMSKKLPPLIQAQIKLQLSNAVLEAQIRMTEEQQCPPSKCSAPIDSASTCYSSYSIQGANQMDPQNPTTAENNRASMVEHPGFQFGSD